MHHPRRQFQALTSEGDTNCNERLGSSLCGLFKLQQRPGDVDSMCSLHQCLNVTAVVGAMVDEWSVLASRSGQGRIPVQYLLQTTTPVPEYHCSCGYDGFRRILSGRRTATITA